MINRFLPTATVVLLLASGTAGAALVPGSLESSRTSTPLANAKGSTPRGIKTVVAANNAFAFDMYSKLRKSEEGKNIFYSPYSVSAALAMTYEGAKGKTAAEMKSVLHFPASRVLRPNFAAIYNYLNSASADYKLQAGNALWVQKSFPLLRKYTEAVRSYYGGKATNLDFVNKTEQSRKTINSFVAKQTANTIKDLIPAGYLDDSIRFVLTNAVYFNGTWLWQFDPKNTQQGDFKIADGKTVKAPMMYFSSYKAEFNYADTKDLQILELPYKGDRISMLLLLPHKSLSSIESSLTAGNLKGYKAQMKPTILDWLSIPKFKLTSRYTLNDTLKGLGMPTAYLAEKADFSGMTGRRDLSLSFVVHQAFVKVDEKGTEAAGATAVGGGTTSARIPTIFNADHPFVFLIQDKKTGNILFLGRVVNPNLS